MITRDAGARGLLLAALLLAAGCGDGAHDAGDGHGHGREPAGAGHADHAGHGHEEGEGAGDHVRLAPESLKEADLGTARPGPARIEVVLDLPGEVVADPDRIAHITPRAAGIAAEVRASLGAVVRAGEVLAVLESPDLGVAKTEHLTAVRDLEIARMDHDRQAEVSANTGRLLELLAAHPSPEEARAKSAGVVVGEEKARLLTAYSALFLARRTREREEDLFARKVGSESDLLAARAALDQAEAAYDATRETAEYGRRSRLLDSERALKVAGSTLQARERRLHLLGVPEGEIDPAGKEPDDQVARYALRTPIDGTVVEKHLVLGEHHETSSPVFVVADLSSVQVRVPVPPADAARVRPGLSVRVLVDGVAGAREGTVDFLGSIADERTRTVEARVRLPNPGGALRPGLFAQAAVAIEATDAKVAVPAEAVLRLEGREVVFVREAEGEFEARPVRVGRRDRATAEILEGVGPEDEVVVRNAFVLKAEIGKEAGGHDH